MLSTLIVAFAVAAVPSIDVKVDGDGYLRFARDGRIAYAKAATLTVTAGKLGAGAGVVLLPSVEVPANAESLEIDLQGTIFVNANQGRMPIGRIVLALFPSNAPLLPSAGLLICQDRPALGSPGDGTNGVIRTGSKPVPVQTPKPTGAKSPPPASPAKGVTPRGTVTIAIAQTSEVAGDKVTLGDVAKISADQATASSLAAIPLCNTPINGVRIAFDRNRIVSAVRNAGFDPSTFVVTVPSGACVSRKSLHVTQQQFVDAAVAYAKTQNLGGATLTGKSQGPDYLAPEGTLELKVEQYTPGLNGAAATVAVYVDGKRLNSRTVRLEITGMDGQPLIRVTSGTRVKIVFRSNDAVVEVQGKTARSAFVGQTVEVTTDQRTKHTGILTGPDRVEVKL